VLQELLRSSSKFGQTTMVSHHKKLVDENSNHIHPVIITRGTIEMSLDKQIVEQVEFYFSDSNLIKDKFLKDLVNKDDEGYVPIETLLTFNRLKKLSNDATVISNALKASTFLKVRKFHFLRMRCL